MPLVGEAKHEIRIFQMKTKAGLEYTLQVEKPNRIISMSAKGVTIPFSQEDIAELWDQLSRAGLWLTEQTDNPLVPRV